MMIRTFLFIFLLHLSFISPFAFSNSKSIDFKVQQEDLEFDRLYFSDPENKYYVEDIIMDDWGFIWFAAKEGVYRYNGLYLQQMGRNSEGVNLLNSRDILSLAYRQKTLWIGSSFTLWKKDLETKEIIAYDTPLSETQTGASYRGTTYAANSGKIYMGYWNGGMVIFDPEKEKMTHFISSSQFPDVPFQSNTITAFANKNDSVLYVAGHDGLFSFHESSVKFHKIWSESKTDQSDFATQVNSIHIVSDSELWLGTNNGLVKLNPETGEEKRYFMSDSPLSNHERNIVESIDIDNDGNIWAGTRYGLFKIEPSTDDMRAWFYDKMNPHSLQGNYIRKVFIDQNGIIWMGHHSGAISYLSKRKKDFVSYSIISNYIADQRIHSVFSEPDKIWFGTETGLYIYHKKSGELQNHRHRKNDPNSLSHDFVSGILKDKYGFYWISTDKGGVNRFDPETKTFKNVIRGSQNLASFSESDIWSIYMDNRDILWCGSGGDGLTAYYINSGETIQYRHDPENPHSLSDNFIGPVIRSNNGTLWVGTLNKGLDYFVPGEDNVQNIRFQQGSENGLSGNSISSLALTNDNMLYIGTEAGVDILQTDSMIVRPFEFNHQLPSTNIRSIVVDKAENIWIATRTGLMKYKPQKQDYQIFYKSDGLVSSNFLPGSAHQSELGEIVLGTEKGLVSFFPWDIERNQKPPLVYITGVLANQVNMTESLSGITNNSENEPRLDHTKNNITFHVAALDFHDPQKNQILYKLEGFENRWKQVGETNTVQYNNLPPGNYTFNVKGANNDNVWNNHGARYSFQISPPYWDTLWFKTVVFMGIILAIFSFIWLQLRKVAGQKKELERLVAFRTAELNEQKQKVEKKNLSLENQKQAIEHQAMLLSQTNQKLEEQKIAIEKQAQELKEMDRIKSGFFANISHEFRTPLTLILNALSLYKEEHRVSSGNDPSDGLKISVIQKNAQRLQRLINQILDVIKIESGFMKLRVAEGNIEEFILAITSLFKLKAEAEKIRLITDIDLHQQIGYMDWDKLEKIIFNLVANAIKFTSSNGTVVVRVTDKLSDSCRNKLQIQVRDNGSGIPFELQERVFSMFFHSETTKNDNRSGTGIGLALAKQLSQIHKGDITLISEPGNGSTFTLQLPRDKRDFSAEEIGNTEISTIKKQHYTDILPSPQEKFMDNSVENHTKPRLLFVDDNKELCYLIREQLKSDFYVEVAFDAIQGLEKSINTYPDIIVSDLMMPKISGIEFCKRVKQDIRTEHLPFILLTARIDEKSEIEALALNADDYITKPYSIEILRLKLRNQMEIREKLESKLRNELQSPEIQKKQGYSNRFMKNASEIIIQNIDNPEFNVDNLATGLNMSRTQLYRKSEKLLGMSANNFIKRVKLNHAWELLEDGEYNISEVAYRVGFKTPGYFSKCFEEQFGVLPSRYIAENSK